MTEFYSICIHIYIAINIKLKKFITQKLCGSVVRSHSILEMISKERRNIVLVTNCCFWRVNELKNYTTTKYNICLFGINEKYFYFDEEHIGSIDIVWNG